MILSSSPFEMKTFNLSKDDIQQIAINISNSGDKCFISDANDKTCIYNEFIIHDGPLVKKFCKIDFSKSSSTKKFIPRLTFYKMRNNEVTEHKRQKVIIEFAQSDKGLLEFWKLISFLKQYKELIDTGTFDERYQVLDNTKYIEEFNSKEELEKVRALKELEINENVIENYLSDKRSHTLEVFRLLLEDKSEIENYRLSNNINQAGDEPVWHHFLQNNKWILGLNAGLVFINEFTDEVQVGNPNTNGSGNPKTDSMGISDYTVLIELKTSNTNIFTKVKTSKARAGTWSFTQDFIEGVSQCLVQKTDWEKNQRTKDLISDEGKVIDQNIWRTIDPNVIFLIGNKQKEINIQNTDVEVGIKRDTFERFRRNNRNIEIITYDELYDRAYYLIHQVKAPELEFRDLEIAEDNIDPEDIPF